MNKPIARKDNIVVQKLKDETLVYDLDENQAFCLNETSALVWELCDGTRDASEISDELSKKLKTLIRKEFVHLALDQLGKDGLLDGSSRDYFSGFSRREAIRKVGFASVAALPIIASLVAPEATAAQSCLALGQTACGSDTDCCQGNCVAPRCCVPGATGVNNVNYSECYPSGTDCNAVHGPVCCSNSARDGGAIACGVNETRCFCNAF